MPPSSYVIWIARATIAMLLIVAAVARVLLAEDKSEAIDSSVAIFLVTAFVIVAIRWDQLRTFKVGGVEVDLAELKESQVRLEEVTTDITSIVTRVEEALVPIIGGTNPHQLGRLQQRELVIGSKDYGEQALLGHLLAEWIQSTVPDITCSRRVPNGGTVRNWVDLTTGRIDGYVEYTGTGGWLLQRDLRGCSRDQALRALNDESIDQGFRVRWLAPLGFDSPYFITARKDTADELQIEKLDDLSERIFRQAAAAGKIVFCCQMDFYQRSDGLKALQEMYGFQFAQVKIVSHAEFYRLLSDGECHLGAAFGTDPELHDMLQRGVLVNLRDENAFFPEYAAVIAFSEDAFETPFGDALGQSLNRLEDHFKGKQKDLVELIGRLDEEGGRRSYGSEKVFRTLLKDILE